MDFFKQLHGVIASTKKVTIIAQVMGDKITVGFFPEFKSEDINEKTKMCSITGTPQEMDEGFFNEIRKPIEAATTGLKSNADEVASEIKEAAEEEEADEKVEKERKDKKAASKKPAPAKKEAPKKEAPKKSAPKKEATKELVPTPQEVHDELVSVAIDAGELPESSDGKESLHTEEIENIETVVEEIVTDEVQIVTEHEANVTPAPVSEFEAEDQEQRCFDILMAEGDAHMKEKNYQAAQTSYLNATSQASAAGNFPNQSKAIKAEQNAGRWVRALERMKN